MRSVTVPPPARPSRTAPDFIHATLARNWPPTSSMIDAGKLHAR